MRISPKAVAHFARAAFGILFIVAFHLGCARRSDGVASVLAGGWALRESLVWMSDFLVSFKMVIIIIIIIIIISIIISINNNTNNNNN